MMRFIDDLAGAVFDFLKFILRSMAYLLAGMFVVGVPLYLFVLVVKMFG